ncbi:hypothetical protein LAZ67_17001124 [Cordylochernes scorpioides]|uniref:Fatty acyl-CoA reductase C-terminal domain-containing protein n=1 Tax=Cordylochernes scorpioides TaxID=51811 RepID=A0ABY6LD45_9ARAC|nr:hypothetical protein LAZ67_17001124 [Cordylochernes scorpioides]
MLRYGPVRQQQNVCNRFVQQYKKMERALHILEFFTLHEWSFGHENAVTLMEELKGQDRETFEFDVRNVNWDKYMESYVLGVRRFLLNEEEDTLPAARKKLNRIYYLTKLANLLVVMGFARLLLARSKMVRQAWRTFLFFGIQLPQMLLSR